MTDKLIIYTDGSCNPSNPGPGGWAAILMFNEHKKEISGGYKLSTNNRMELYAVINALQILKRPASIILYTDSQYVKNAFTNNWLVNWKKNDWKTAAKKPVANKDLWIILDELVNIHNIEFKWIKAHDINEFNNRCDILAKSAALNKNNPDDKGYKK